MTSKDDAIVRIAGPHKMHFHVTVSLEWEKPSVSAEQDGARLLVQAMAQERATESVAAYELFQEQEAMQRTGNALQGALKPYGGKLGHD